MKEWIAFLEQNWGKGCWKFYKLNPAKTWYVLEEDNNAGFPVEKVKKYPHLFRTGDSKEIIQAEIHYERYVRKYGDGTQGDVKCPACGRLHDICGNHADDEYWEVFSEEVDCFCGVKFRTEVEEVKIVFKTKLL